MLEANGPRYALHPPHLMFLNQRNEPILVCNAHPSWSSLSLPITSMQAMLFDAAGSYPLAGPCQSNPSQNHTLCNGMQAYRLIYRTCKICCQSYLRVTLRCARFDLLGWTCLSLIDSMQSLPFFSIPFRDTSLNPSCHCRWIQEEVPCGRRSKRGDWLFSFRTDRGNTILTPIVSQ